MHFKFLIFFLLLLMSQLSFALTITKSNIEYKLSQVQELLIEQDVLISGLSKKINKHKRELKAFKAQINQGTDLRSDQIIGEYEEFIKVQEEQLRSVKLRYTELIKYFNILSPKTVLSSLEGFELFSFFSSLNTILEKIDGKSVVVSPLVLDETKKQKLVESSAQLLTLFPELIKGLYGSDELEKAAVMKKIKDAVEVVTFNIIDVLDVDITGVKSAAELTDRIENKIMSLTKKRESADL